MKILTNNLLNFTYFLLFCDLSHSQDLTKPDPFVESATKDQEAVMLFLKSLDSEHDPISKFLVCAIEVINTNKFLAAPENQVGLNFVYTGSDHHQYGFGEIPTTEEERTRYLEAAKAHTAKGVARNQKLAVKTEALELMKEEIGKMEPSHQDIFIKFLKSLDH